MIKNSKKTRFEKRNFEISYIVPIILIGILMLAVLSFFVLNTFGLDKQLKHHVLNEADDVSALQADNISDTMRMRKNYMANLADTFSRMPEFVLTEELMERKAQYLEMDRIFMVSSSDFAAEEDEDRQDVKEYMADHPEIFEEPQIFYTGHGKIFISVPISRQDSKTTELLVGTRTNDMLQQLLQDVDLKNRCISCIIDQKGTLIVSPTDNTSFMELEKTFMENPEREREEIQKVYEDIGAHHSSTVNIKTVNGKSMMLCYDFLNINDWILMTVFPIDSFIGKLDMYLTKYVFAIVIMVLAMLLILFYIVLSSRRSLRKIRSVAFVDSLTGGKNGLAFQLEGERQLQEYPQQQYAIVYLDIRNFKGFNERYGIKTGDEILRRIYNVLSSCMENGELMARSSDDHFYLLLQCDSEGIVRQRLETAFGILEEQLSGQFFLDRTCIAQGAYMIPKEKLNVRVLQDRAKVASTYQLDTRICRFYDESLARQKEREQWLEDSFEQALKNHEFKLYLQPKVCPKKNEVQGGEALVRWENREYGMLPPGEFIPFFEQNGKICELDFYMFEETCRLLNGWLKEGRAIPLSVNLSRAHLNAGNLKFLDRFKAIKEEYEIPDGLIELELTESLMIERREIHLAMSTIERIREIGLLCSIDDFGFGYSSLAMLKDLNVTVVKLDRQFFLDETGKSWIVVRQLIDLAHALGMTVVAEGIEEQGQVERLKQCNCDLIQGYVYAKPMAVPDFLTWMNESD